MHMSGATRLRFSANQSSGHRAVLCTSQPLRLSAQCIGAGDPLTSGIAGTCGEAVQEHHAPDTEANEQCALSSPSARQVPIATVPNPAARTLTWTLRAHTHTAPGDGEAGGDGLSSAGVCVVQP